MATRILVVNDTQEILEMFRLILEDEGYEVRLSSYPMQQISDIEALKPDLIILDLVFHDEKAGWQMLQLLKMQPKTSKIPVILCTAAEQAVREMEGYLVSKKVLVVYKPFEIDDLLRTVTMALQSHTVDEEEDHGPKADEIAGG